MRLHRNPLRVVVGLVEVLTLLAVGCGGPSGEGADSTDEALKRGHVLSDRDIEDQLDVDSSCTAVDRSGFWCGDRLESSDVKALLRNAGFKPSTINTMLCIAANESGRQINVGTKNETTIFYAQARRANIARNARGDEYISSIDRGLFQVNSITNDDVCDGLSTRALWDPKTNTACAYKIYQRQGFNAWAAYGDCH